MSSKSGTLKNRSSGISVNPAPGGSSSSSGSSGMNTLKGKSSMSFLASGGAGNTGDSMRSTFSKNEIIDGQNVDNSIITCESVRRTLTRFYLYKIIVEKVIYILFWPAMVILMYLSLVYFQDSDNNFFVVDGVINAFCGDEWEFEFSRINSINDFYKYMHQGFLDELNNDEEPNKTVTGFHLQYLQLKLIQNRVKPVKCKQNKYVVEAYLNESDSDYSYDPESEDDDYVDCYPVYSESSKSTESYGGDNIDPRIADGFKFSKLKYYDKIKGINAKYPTEGFIIDLPLDVEEIDELIDVIKDSDWIDQQTRAVTISIAAYNYNLKVYILAEYLVEFSVGGSCRTRPQYYPFRVNFKTKYNSIFEAFMVFFVVNGIVFIYQLYSSWCRVRKHHKMSQNKVSNSFLYKKLTDENENEKGNNENDNNGEEGNDVKEDEGESKKNDSHDIKEKTSYAMSISLSIFQTLTNPIWNLLYLLSYILYLAVIIRYHMIYNDNIDDSDPENLIYNIGKKSENQENFMYFSGFTALFGVILIFNGFTFVSHVIILWTTIFNGAIHLFVFAVMFIVIIFGFSCVAHSTYGNYIYEYSRMPKDFMHLLYSAFSGLDFYELYYFHINFSVIFFLVFFFVVSIILLNVFIAILCDSYNKVKFVKEGKSDDEDTIFTGQSGGNDSSENIWTKIKKEIKNRSQILWYSYFSSVSDYFEEYYIKKMPATGDDEEPISFNNFVFDHSTLLDWDAGNSRKYRVEKLWFFLTTFGGELSRFEVYTSHIFFVDKIIDDLKKERDENKENFTEETYQFDSEFLELTNEFYNVSKVTVPLEHYIADSKNNVNEKLYKIHNELPNDINMYYNTHIGFDIVTEGNEGENDEEDDEKDEKDDEKGPIIRKKEQTIKFIPNGLIYCGRTYMPKGYLCHLKCGPLSGLPCPDCRYVLNEVLRETINTYYKSRSENSPVRNLLPKVDDFIKKFSKFDISLGNISIRDFRVRTLMEICSEEYEKFELKLKSGKNRIKNYLLGGVRCDKCHVRYYSFYRPFLCFYTSFKGNSAVPRPRVDFLAYKICTKCVFTNFSSEGNHGRDFDGDFKQILMKNSIHSNDPNIRTSLSTGDAVDIIPHKTRRSYRRLNPFNRQGYGIEQEIRDMIKNVFIDMRWAFNIRDQDTSYDKHFDIVEGILAENESVKDLYAKFKEVYNDRSFKTSSDGSSPEPTGPRKSIPDIFFEYFKERSKRKDYSPEEHRDAISDITFNIVDKNKSGIIGLNEYYRYVHHLNRICTFSRAKDEFAKFDTDDSNAIDIQEFREIFKIAIYGFRDAEPRFIFDLLDPSGDGKISFEEFMTYFEQNEPDYPKSALFEQFKEYAHDEFMSFPEFETFFAKTFKQSSEQSSSGESTSWMPDFEKKVGSEQRSEIPNPRPKMPLPPRK